MQLKRKINHHSNAPYFIRIEFAKQLFNGNPECLDLSEYISEAETALQNGQRDKALSLAENAAEACNKLIEQKKTFEPLTTQAVFLDKIKIQLESRTSIIIASQVLALIIILVGIILYFKKRKRSKHKQRRICFKKIEHFYLVSNLSKSL